MLAHRTVQARHMALDGSSFRSSRQQAPRAAWFCRLGSPRCIGFALTLLMLAGILPTAGVSGWAATSSSSFAEQFDFLHDANGNGVEDLLDTWLAGNISFADLRNAAVAAPARARAAKGMPSPEAPLPSGTFPAEGSWSAGRLRLISLGAGGGGVARVVNAAKSAGTCRVLHSLEKFGGVSVLEVDKESLRAILIDPPGGRLMLDRDGIPALVDSRGLVGADNVAGGNWQLGDDWSSTLAILDSGCDTAHGDLGDFPDDDIDGPPPAVGDSGDWYSAENGWPLFEGYKVVGWHDVTDDFPASAGPWDYHYHGTALASVVAGSGRVDPDYRGMAPGGRLTVVKYYDYDGIWHAWAGDFLAACAWTLENRDTYRIGTVLTAVNWDVDAGISTAMASLVDAGLLPVAAIGNYGTGPEGPGYPAALADVLTVGAVNGSGALSAFSGRGLNVSDKPDLLAPGGGLLPSGGRITTADNEPDDSYSERFGTSLAAAHVAGAAHLLDEAMLENGVILPRNRNSVLTRLAMLKLTAAPVTMAETSSGEGHSPLSFPEGPDGSRGWGLVRVDAAVDGMLRPLMPGLDQLDTLSLGWEEPVAARRLITSPGVRYLIEAVPAGNLDVVLEVADPLWLEDPSGYNQVRRTDVNGPGVSEFTYLRPNWGDWLVLVVKRKSGQGAVSLKIREADSFSDQGASAVLPGLGTGAPNSGFLAGTSGESLVIPSRVTVDLAARSLSVFDHGGVFRPGWPVFVFPHSSSQGGLSQPMIWDMDGNAGDEIVVSSDFGSVYFFTGDGFYEEVELTLNRSLSQPVGVVAGGNRRVAVVDKLGTVRSWSHGPVLEAEADLGHNLPLAPAAGRLVPGSDETLVVAFADGHVTALDSSLNPLPGWPVDIGEPLEVAPVLCDMDKDGLHEVVLFVRDSLTGLLSVRVFDSVAGAGPGDRAVIAAPEGGGWLALSQGVIAGGYGSDDLKIAVTGLAENGMFGDQAGWVLGQGALNFDGTSETTLIPDFRVKASTDQGNLTLDNIILSAPLAWNFEGGSGSDVSSLVAVNWTEILIGLTSLPGGCASWFGDGAHSRPLVFRQPVTTGGRTAPVVASASSMLVPGDGEVFLRVDVLDNKVGIMPVRGLKSSSQAWMAARGDGRNSGAYPLPSPVSEVPVVVGEPNRLVVYPNPGGGQFHFRVSGLSGSTILKLEIFDLRGRRLKVRTGGNEPGVIGWDGTDHQGRPLAAGTYLAVVRGAGEPLTTRVVLTR